MAILICSEYSPTYCETCGNRDLCTERMKRRNKKLVQQACRFQKLLVECSRAHNAGTLEDIKNWSEIYNDFFSSRFMLSKESFCLDVDKHTNKDSKNFADRLKRLYCLFDDLILSRVDRAKVAEMELER